DGNTQRMPCGAAGQRQIKHHDHERECGKDRDQRDHATEQHAFQALQRGVPTRERGPQQPPGGWRTQVAVRYMHGQVRLDSAYLILTYSGLILASKATVHSRGGESAASYNSRRLWARIEKARPFAPCS